ncbi:hypothetical protein BJ742DRAFT_41805 [Cladochytrium replicatum]|nr:hypothetical protein BJ742DRAFT_41805 [Cladochytrium replicatum]
MSFRSIPRQRRDDSNTTDSIPISNTDTQTEPNSTTGSSVDAGTLMNANPNYQELSFCSSVCVGQSKTWTLGKPYRLYFPYGRFFFSASTLGKVNVTIYGGNLDSPRQSDFCNVKNPRPVFSVELDPKIMQGLPSLLYVDLDVKIGSTTCGSLVSQMNRKNSFFFQVRRDTICSLGPTLSHVTLRLAPNTINPVAQTATLHSPGNAVPTDTVGIQGSPESPIGDDSKSRRPAQTDIIVAIVIGLVVIAIAICTVVFCLRRRRNKDKERKREHSDTKALTKAALDMSAASVERGSWYPRERNSLYAAVSKRVSDRTPLNVVTELKRDELRNSVREGEGVGTYCPPQALPQLAPTPTPISPEVAAATLLRPRCNNSDHDDSFSRVTGGRLSGDSDGSRNPLTLVLSDEAISPKSSGTIPLRSNVDLGTEASLSTTLLGSIHSSDRVHTIPSLRRPVDSYVGTPWLAQQDNSSRASLITTVEARRIAESFRRELISPNGNFSRSAGNTSIVGLKRNFSVSSVGSIGSVGTVGSEGDVSSVEGVDDGGWKTLLRLGMDGEAVGTEREDNGGYGGLEPLVEGEDNPFADVHDTEAR